MSSVSQSDLSQLPAPGERKERRRLHLREVAEDTGVPPAATQDSTEQASVGATLRAARIARGEAADAVANALKMKREQLDAIESDDFAKLPGRTYAVGFVRAYARHVGLDAERILQRFKDERAGELAKPVDLVFPDAVEERQLPNGSILVLALLIAMVIYGLTYLTMPSRKAATAKAQEPVVVVEQAQAQAEAAAVDSDEALTAAFVAGGASLPETKVPEPTTLAVDSPHDALEAPRHPQMEAFAIAEGPLLGSGGADASSSSRITLRALQQTYLQVRDTQLRGPKSVLFSRVLEPGETYAAPNRPGLVMQTGNAGGLQVEVEGKVVGVLGRSGQVITRIPLDASYFLEHFAASQ